MKNSIRKIMALLLTLIMILNVTPISAFAGDGDPVTKNASETLEESSRLKGNGAPGTDELVVSVDNGVCDQSH